jgi:PAS domain S-box-containing protein
VTDVTQERRAERALRESEERYRSLVTATAAIVGIADRDGRFTTPRPSWEAYTDQPSAEHRDDGYIDALHPEDKERAATAWLDARERGVLFEYEARLHHGPSGTYRYCLARVVPIVDPETGAIREWVSYIVDVDERRRAEMLAEEARAEAESANAAKDEFLATLSHELRSPLQGAMGWLALLRAGRLSAEQTARAVTTIERSIRHQAQLVNDLLDVSPIVSGKLHVEMNTLMATVGSVVSARRAGGGRIG